MKINLYKFFKHSTENYVSKEEFAKVLEIKLAKEYKNGSSEIAIENANFIYDFFGQQTDRIIDNILLPQERQVFYFIQSYDLIYTDSEEVTLWDGRDWRIHYWIINKDNIRETINNNHEENNHKENDMTSIYEGDIWDRIRNSRK